MLGTSESGPSTSESLPLKTAGHNGSDKNKRETKGISDMYQNLLIRFILYQLIFK